MKIVEVFRSHCDRVEKASIDESFLDLSTLVKSALLKRYPELSLPPPNDDFSCPLPPAPTIMFLDEMGAIVPLSDGYMEEDPIDWDDVAMFLAAEIIGDIRKEVEEKLGYTCSAGIAKNKMLAKLAAGWKKPNQQVHPIVPSSYFRLFYEIAPYQVFSRRSSLPRSVCRPISQLLTYRKSWRKVWTGSRFRI